MKNYKYRVWFERGMSGYEKVNATEEDEMHDEKCYYYYTKREAVKDLKVYLKREITDLRTALKEIK